MSSDTLKVAFLWHMHQPFYLDPETKKFKMPWVRLHAIKDYLDMLLNVLDFEKITPVFNFTPSLLEQIEMYLNGTPELHIELTLKAPSDLTPLEKNIILKDFFMANWDTMIKPFPRYYELLLKRGEVVTPDDFTNSQRFFNNQDFIDLQLLFNLTWIDPSFREKDDFLQYLIKKGKYYTQQDKELLIDKHFEIMRKIFSTYKTAVLNKRIELSVSPFYHPILPLLIDNYIATKSDPTTVLPKLKFAYPIDALSQIKNAVSYAEEKFGERPIGMWPSEGSVSNDAINLITKSGFIWAATDENVLANSLNTPNLLPENLFRSYRFEAGENKLHLFFREHKLSDNIGFVYNRMSAEDATEHFIKNLHKIHYQLNSIEKRDDYIVSIILDGENAWEFYPEDGNKFLRLLYQKLENDPLLEVITFSNYLSRYNTHQRLTNIHPGSWINANFRIWIGHSEDNAAWDLLTEARTKIEERKEQISSDSLSNAMKSLYIAEGSDWCWWYGDEHSTEFDVEFDELFREYVKDIYRNLGLPYPAELDLPIVKKEKEIKPDKEMLNFITPKIDGRNTSYFEWLGACSYNLKKFGFSMHRTHVYFENLFIGFDHENIYFRLDPEPGFVDNKDYFPVEIKINCNTDYEIKGTINFEKLTTFTLKTPSESFELETAFSKIVEIKVPLSLMNLEEGNNVSLFVFIRLKDLENIRFPVRRTVNITVPSKHFEDYMWHA